MQNKCGLAHYGVPYELISNRPQTRRNIQILPQLYPTLGVFLQLIQTLHSPRVLFCFHYPLSWVYLSGLLIPSKSWFFFNFSNQLDNSAPICGDIGTGKYPNRYYLYIMKYDELFYKFR